LRNAGPPKAIGTASLPPMGVGRLPSATSSRDVIRSATDLRSWVRADFAAHDLGNASAVRVLRTLANQPQLRWQVRLRLVELLVNRARSRPGRVLGALMRWRVQQAGVRLGFTIPPNVFGPGLKLPHWGTIVISPEAVVGRGCVVHPGVTLGLNHGRAPRLGDDVYLGPGAKIFGGLCIGDRVTVGANSVVTRDVPADTRVVGAPARPIRGIGEAAKHSAELFRAEPGA
jgi:serine O-acetyltransferase